MTLRTIIPLGALLAALFPALPAAAAGEPLDEAKAAFGAGKQAFERGDYETALAQFQKANAIAPAPSLHYNMGRVLEALGRYHEAASEFEKYLEMYGAPPNDEEKQFQENLRSRIATDRARTDRVGSAPVPPPAYPPPPSLTQPYPPGYYYTPPPGYYYPPPPYYVDPKTTQLRSLRRTRASAIGLIVSGAVLDALGLLICGVSALAAQSDTLIGGEVTGAVMFLAPGTIMLPIGIVMLKRTDAKIQRLEMPEPAPAPRTGGVPHAVMFNSPVIRF